MRIKCLNENIELEIQYTIDDYARGLTYIQRRQFIFKCGIFILPLIPLALFLITFIGNPESLFEMSPATASVNIVPFLLLFVFLLAVAKFPSPILKWSLRKQFNSSPALRAKQLISFAKDGIETESELSSSRTKWEAVVEAAETRDDFFFFSSSKFAMFVPKSVMSEIQIITLRELANRNLLGKAKFWENEPSS